MRASVKGVWESIGFGLLLSAAILYLFLKNWTGTFVATIVIPICSMSCAERQDSASPHLPARAVTSEETPIARASLARQAGTWLPSR